MARTLPTDGVSPIDAYSSTCDRPLGYFEAAIPAAESGEATLKVKVTDARTSGDNYVCTGLAVDFDVSGADSKYIWASQIDVDITGKTGGGVYALEIDMATSSNPTMGYMGGIYMYLESGGTACETIHGMRIQIDQDDVTTRASYFALRRLGSGAHANSSVFFFETTSLATYFIEQATAGPPHATGSHRTDTGDSIKCKFGGTVKYIALYT
jgi:hypothetical protein